MDNIIRENPRFFIQAIGDDERSGYRNKKDSQAADEEVLNTADKKVKKLIASKALLFGLKLLLENVDENKHLILAYTLIKKNVENTALEILGMKDNEDLLELIDRVPALKNFIDVEQKKEQTVSKNQRRKIFKMSEFALDFCEFVLKHKKTFESLESFDQKSIKNLHSFSPIEKKKKS